MTTGVAFVSAFILTPSPYAPATTCNVTSLREMRLGSWSSLPEVSAYGRVQSHRGIRIERPARPCVFRRQSPFHGVRLLCRAGHGLARHDLN